VGPFRIFSRYADPANGRAPVVLVHGLSVSSAYMIPLANALAPNFPVFAPDLPGYGNSEKPEHVLDLQELAAALVDWMGVIGLERAVMLGNSMGCQIILEVAHAHPRLVERAVLVGPTMDPRAPGSLSLILRGARNMLYEPLSLIPVLVRDYWAAGLWRTFRTLRLAQREPVRERLARMPVPALVVRGEHDSIAPQRWAEEAARLLPDGRLVVIPKSAHATNYDASHALAAVTARFIDEGNPTPPSGSPTF
jgi:pimeloyl-ACP methyl ester carboxylesterase